MPSVMAIVSKAVFEKAAGKTIAVGDLFETDRYASTPGAFAQLAEGDAVFLVTVRPPNEKLWLVGIIEKPAKKSTTWVGAPNTTPIRDVTALIKKFRFTSGKGIESKPGALAMSLQTPRILSETDAMLLRGATPSGTLSDAPRVARKSADAARPGVSAKPRRAARAESFSAIIRRAATALWRKLGENVTERSPNWKQFDLLYPASGVLLEPPSLDLENATVTVSFEYQASPHEAPVLTYVQGDDEPAYVFISAVSAEAWRSKQEPSKKELKAIAKRHFHGCYHHEFSDIVKVHSEDNDTCLSAD